MKVKVKILREIKRPDGSIVDLTPVKATTGSAGFDLKSVEDGIVFPGTKRKFGTGVALAIEEGYEGQVRSRSGIASKASCFVINSPGTIDSDYRGEVVVMLHNLGAAPFEVNVGDRIAQLVIAAVPAVAMEKVDVLDDTARGSGGFGSTGVAS